MATLQEMERALIGADKAGDTDAARRLAAAITQERGRMEADPTSALDVIPGVGGEMQIPELRQQQQQPEEQGFGDQIIGAGEAALTTATGATSGTVGMIGNTLKQLADEMLKGEFGSAESAQRVQRASQEGMEALTYAPRTEAGQDIVQTIGEVTAPLAGAIPLASEMQAAGAGARAVAPIARTTAQRVSAPAVSAAMKVRERISEATPSKKSTAGTAPSAGAAGVDVSTLRQAQADELPIPVKLTKGQKTRKFEDVRFERETAKDPEKGVEIRQRFEEQNEQLLGNLDAFIDETGSQISDLRGIGEIVDKSLRQRATKDKVRIRTLYKEAEKAGEMEEPVELEGLITVLNESRSAESTAPVLVAARKELVRLGGAVEDEEGNLVVKTSSTSTKPITEPVITGSGMTLNNVEQLRKFVNKVAGNDPTNIKFAGDIKRAIDAATEGKGGNLYKQARAARAKYAMDYENTGLVKRLLNTKRGSEDRAIALEDVLRKSILDPGTSLDDVRQVRRLLQTKGGPEASGKQAWKELQGGTLRHIQEQITKNIQIDQRGNRILSPAALDRQITQLDKTGKLDFVFGKKGAEQLRTINEVAQTVLTSPPGTINHSNTASVLAGLMDVAMTGVTGIPAPIATSFRLLTGSVKDAKLKAKIKQALGE